MIKLHPLGLKITLSLFLLSAVAFGQYEISGKLSNYDSLWQNRLYLAWVSPDESFNSVSADQIINSTILDKSGNFILKGSNIPKTNSIVRLYVVSVREEVQFVGGPGNYLLLILNKKSKIEIEAKNFSKDPLDYQLSGDLFEQNEKIREFELDLRSSRNLDVNPDLVLKNGGNLKVELNNRITREFCESNPYTLVSILALQHINMEADYRNYPGFYRELLQRFHKSDENTSPYVKAFQKKLELIEFKNHPGEEHKTLAFSAQLIIILFLIILGLLLTVLFYIRRNSNKKQNEFRAKASDFNVGLTNQLTKREKEIMALLIRDYQNKEIASELYLEVSTIKTHLSKIYQKLGVSNRNEAVEKFKSL